MCKNQLQAVRTFVAEALVDNADTDKSDMRPYSTGACSIFTCSWC